MQTEDVGLTSSILESARRIELQYAMNFDGNRLKQLLAVMCDVPFNRFGVERVLVAPKNSFVKSEDVRIIYFRNSALRHD